MTKVMVRYLNLVSKITGTRKEEMDIKNLKELLTQIGNQHPEINTYLYENEDPDLSVSVKIILSHNGQIINPKESQRNFNEGDEIIFIPVIGGGDFTKKVNKI